MKRPKSTSTINLMADLNKNHKPGNLNQKERMRKSILAAPAASRRLAAGEKTFAGAGER